MKWFRQVSDSGWLFVPMLICLMSCSSKNSATLSRSTALELLQDDRKKENSLPSAPSVFVRAMVHLRAGESCEKAAYRTASESSYDRPLKVAMDMGLLRGTPSGTVCWMTPTQKGQEIIKKEGWEYLKQLGASGWKTPMSTGTRITEVTGIADAGMQGFQVAEFTWMYEPTLMGKHAKQLDNKEFDAPKEGKAVFQKFDDGWRVQR